MMQGEQSQQPTTSTFSKDLVLVFSLGYLCIDLASTWSAFDTCPSPIHKWLLGSYLLVMCGRLIDMGTNYVSPGRPAAVLVDLRQKDRKLRAVVSFTWWVGAPLMVLWSCAGTVFTWRVVVQAPECMPSALHSLFLLLWQVMCYAWVAIYCGLGFLAWALERHLQRTERDLREITDEDVEQRWGSVSTLEGYNALPATMASRGMTPAEIRNLEGACRCSQELAEKAQDCSICLAELQEGDHVRRLGACGHVFHRSCLDLWLLRSSECPLCKVKLTAST